MKDIRIALIVGASTGIITSLYVAIRMILGFGGGYDMFVLPGAYILSDSIALRMAGNSISLTYKTALWMLIYSNIFSSVIFAAIYPLLDKYLFPDDGDADPFFMGILIIQLMVRWPINIIAAIFHRAKPRTKPN